MTDTDLYAYVTVGASAPSSERILIADDESQILLLIQRLLERSGYQVDTAEDGLIAIGRLRQNAESGAEGYGLVLSDLKMPGADGLHVLQEVKEHYPDTMFVLITGYATLDSAVAALRQGAYDYLTKPLDFKHLLSTVRRALEHRALALQNKRLLVHLQETADALRRRTESLEQLHREEQRKTQQLRLVNAIARQITAILNVETLVTTVLDLVGPAFDFTALSFGLIEGENLSFRGGLLDGETMPVAQSVLWRLTDGGHSPYVRRPGAVEAGLFGAGGLAASGTAGDVTTDPGYDLIFPLQTGEQALGFWVANWREGAGFREQDLPYLEAVAAQTVTVLENARLYALARQADELSFLNQVSREANRSLDLDQTIEGVLRCVQAAFDASLVEICLLDDGQEIDHVFSLVQEEENRSPAACCRHSRSSALLGNEFVRRAGSQPFLVCEPPPSSCERPADGEGLYCSRLGVALRFGEQRIGVLGVASREPAAYDMEKGHLLQVVAGQVAAAIENARLFREVESGRLEILESRNTLQALFDGILEGIYIVDREYRVLAINRTQAAWAAMDVSELAGAPAERAFPASHCSLPLIQETFATGRPRSRPERQRTSDGQWTEWEIHTYPIARPGEPLSPAGDTLAQQVERVVVVVRDVTEQRWLEASLLQSEKMAAIGTLAAGIGHEINNPMTVISANAQILREEISSTHPYYGSIQLIDRASERASKIVRNLLDFSRSEEFEYMPTDVNLSLRDAMSLVEPQLRKAGIEVMVELDPGLPVISASPDHLHVVWLNLLLNARDAIADAGVPEDVGGSIRVTSHRRGDRIIVHIADSGMGIPPEQLKHVFEPFFTTKQPGKGTGLGLFTCYRTIARHGGEINVDSQVGRGTTFQVSLPIGQNTASDT